MKRTEGQMTLRELQGGGGDDWFLQLPRAKPEHPYDIEFLGEDTTLYPSKRADAEHTLGLWNASDGKTTAQAVTYLEHGAEMVETLKAIKELIPPARLATEAMRPLVQMVDAVLDKIEAECMCPCGWSYLKGETCSNPICYVREDAS